MNKAELVELWNNFITGYCKVEFLCYGGEPNWLGWVALPVLAVLVYFAALVFLLAFLQSFKKSQ
jgi:hypothetical protein